jgi:pyruvate/2-oxoglutarate dehydrogenase complex dihydrolipoamide dehydrogenase (E3) component
VHRLVRDADRFGTSTGDVTLDWPAIVARQHEVVKQFQPAAADLEAKGVKVYAGEARFDDAHTLRVDANGAHDTVRGRRIIVAAGSASIIPPKLDGARLGITSDDLLFLPDFPQRLVLVGGGAIGLEMAGAFSDLGATVDVILREDEILRQFDADVAAYLRQILEARGVTFHRSAELTALTGRPGAVVARFTVGGAARELPPAVVCLALGRRWTPAMLGADALGFEVTPGGLRTSVFLQTSVTDIYAAGDAAGNMQLTPTAAYEGRTAATNALRGDHVRSDLSVVPQTVFTTPEIARVGLTHAEATRRGLPCHVSTHDMRGASNGVVSGEDDGYLKLVFESTTERVLGVQIVSYAAAELIQLAALAVRSGATATALSTQLSVHPSHAERFIKIAAHEYHEVCEI